MAHSFEELSKMTVANLREIAKAQGDVEALHGHTTMHKQELVLALCKALGLEAHAHHEVTGIDKPALKKKIRDLKVERGQALEAHDAVRLKRIRREIHRLKHRLRSATH